MLKKFLVKVPYVVPCTLVREVVVDVSEEDFDGGEEAAQDAALKAEANRKGLSRTQISDNADWDNMEIEELPLEDGDEEDAG